MFIGNGESNSYTVPDSQIVLTEKESHNIGGLAASVTAKPDRQPEQYCLEAKLAARRLPTRLIGALYDFARRSTPSGVLVISNLPLNDAPITPDDNKSHIGETTTLAKIQAICNESLGHMIGYEAEGAGRLFQDMVPSKASARTQTSLSSAIELEVHTEQAFSTLRPDYLSLACVRGDSNARTYVLRARDVVASVGEDAAKALRSPLWTTRVDESFRVGDRQFIDGDVRGPVPIISGAFDDPFMILDQDLMRGIDAEAQRLLEYLSDAYAEQRTAYVLSPGQLLILDNDRVAHGRSDFQAKFDGTDRFIIRSFVVRDLTKSRYARPDDSRIVAAKFS